MAGVTPNQLGGVIAKGKHDNVGYMYATPADACPTPTTRSPMRGNGRRSGRCGSDVDAPTPRGSKLLAAGTSATSITVGWPCDGARDLAR